MALQGPKAATPEEATASAATHTAMAISHPRFAGHAIGQALYALDKSDYTSDEIQAAIAKAVGDHLFERPLASSIATDRTSESS